MHEMLIAVESDKRSDHDGLVKNVRIIALFNLFLNLRFHVAIAPIYFAHVTGSLTRAAIVLAMVYVSAALLEVPTGVISDRIGRRRSAIAGAAASLLSVAFYAWGANFEVLLIGAAFEGLRRAMLSGNNEALLFESLKATGSPDKYAAQFGRTESSAEIAIAICAPAGALIAAWDLRAAFAIGLLPQLLCMRMALRLTEPPRLVHEVGNTFSHIGDAARLFRKNRQLRLLTIANAISFGVGEAGFNFRPAVIATVWPVWALGIAQFIGNLGTAVSSWFAGPVIKRFGVFGGMIGSTLFQRAVCILGTVQPTVASPVLLASMGFGYGVRNVGERTLLQEHFSDEQRATMGSLISLLGNLVLGAGLVSMGVIADALNPARALLLAQLVMLAPIAIYVSLFRHASSLRQG